jgi:hypothetical protein
LERSDLLLTTDQIGMALAGFAGLVTLLGRPEPRADARLNEIRREMGRVLVNGAITMLLIAVCSGIAVLLALNTAGAFAAVAGVYFAALFANFLAASFFFLRLLYGSFPPAEGA